MRQTRSSKSAQATSTPAMPSASTRIPAEILSEIFSYCDPPTLAAASRASFAFLELASRPLYEDIILDDPRSMTDLLERHQVVEGDDQPTASARISTHTSLSLIHSITFTGSVKSDGQSLDFDLGDDWTPLAVPVFVLCIPPSADNGLDLDFLSLFKPTIFIAQGPLGQSQTLSTDKYDPGEWTLVAPSSFEDHSPSVVIQSGVHFESYGFLGRGRTPVRVLVDFLPAGETTSDRFGFGYTFGEMHGNIMEELSGYEARAWVTSEESKVFLEELLAEEGNEFGTEGRVGKTVFADVASPRLLNFKEEMGKGVKKWMDWAVLDERQPSRRPVDEEEDEEE